jgi:hypothetical protein
MQMIDVLKRLQELDANNSNVIKESTVEECGPMGMMSPTQPKTPATINITADSGEELGSMLSAIMKLAGVNKVEPDHLGKEHDPSIMTATPTLGIPATDGEVMRGVLDKMNPEVGDGEEETDEADSHSAQFDNTPNDPRDTPAFDANEYSSNSNDGSGDDEQGKPRTMSQPAALEARLMDEYKKFISEDRDDDDYFSGISRDVDAMSHGGDEYSPRHDPLARFGGAGGDADAAVHSLGDIVKKDEEPVVAHAYFDNDAVEKNLRRAKHEKLEKDENGNWYFPVRGKLASRETKHHLVYLQRFFGEPTHVEKAEEPAMDND